MRLVLGFGNVLLITHKFAKSYPKASSPSSALAVISAAAAAAVILSV